MTSRLGPVSLLRARDVQCYRICEDLTEPLIYLMAVFSPWAFGTTQPWSIWTMNIAGYCLGALLTVKVFVRQVKGYVPPRWDHESPVLPQRDRRLSAGHLTTLLIVLTIGVLAYCLVGALNAAATYDPRAPGFTYHNYQKWLPHSFDSRRTWSAFWNYLALACAFWAIVDWLPGKTIGEERAARQPAVASLSGQAPLLPARLRRLLWVLCINGALVGLEGSAQRLEGSGRLLFLIKPVINPEAVSQFGPYHYRANASAYFNLIWPVCLGFWWTLHRSSGLKQTKHHGLLLCAIIMAACPIISTSRGGAFVAVGILVLATFFLVATHFLLVAQRQEDRQARKVALILSLVFFATTLALGFAVGWNALKPRLAELLEGFANREEMYAAARPMAADYPVFGTGPGTFDNLFQLYRTSTETYWPAQLHNDWLETRITFGWLGCALIGLALVTVMARWFARGGLHGGRRFMILMWLALAGCLVHARFDFPFQIYSILFLFLVLCAVAFNLSRSP
jgi:hypothetical protein